MAQKECPLNWGRFSNPGFSVSMSNTIDAQYIRGLLQKGNLPQAEIFLRMAMDKEPDNPLFPYYLGELAMQVGMPQFALEYFQKATGLAPEWAIPAARISQLGMSKTGDNNTQIAASVYETGDQKTDKFLLIKAWGYGFWSDVFHVLGMLLLAEITGRIPVVHWGSNSHFGDVIGTNTSNTFDAFFEPVSAYSIDDLCSSEFDFFPPKWNRVNLYENDVNKWFGSWARIAGLYCLNRPETIVVSDFYTGVIDLKPWIPIGHSLYGQSVDDLYEYLIKKYLKPRRIILDKVDVFLRTSLKSVNYISVHMRGSDKIVEVIDLGILNSKYFAEIDSQISKCQAHRIFLMTDDESIRETFFQRYGDKTVVTDCQRTSNKYGIHYHQNIDKNKLGVEVMVDTYIAAKGQVFIGNASSNPSLMVRYLKGWGDSNVKLLGHNTLHMLDTYPHNW